MSHDFVSNNSYRCVLALCFVISFPAFASTLDQRYREFVSRQREVVSVGLSAEELASRVNKSYLTFREHAFSRERNNDLSNSDISILFQAADEASFYTSSPAIAFDMEVLSRELKGRNGATISHLKKTYLALIAARQYTAARQWRLENNLEISPRDFEPEKLPSKEGSVAELVFKEAGISFSPFSIPKGGFMLVIAHPQCHFSQYAVQEIFKTPDVARSIAGRSKWIAPQQREEQPRVFREWNDRYLGAPMSQAYDMASWRMIDTWETPTFYFFRDGIVKEKIVGWPKEGRMKELRKALKSVGLTEELR